MIDRSPPPRRRVVVTGGTRGIGLRCVERFAALGEEVFACDVDGEALAALDARHLPGVHACEMDVGSEASVDRFFARPALADGLDVVVNCAGVQRFGNAEQTSLETWNEVLRVNVTGAFLVSRRAVALMRNRGGAIVNLASIHARLTAGSRVAYVASKAALVGLTKAMSLDHAGDGIRVNAVLPGAIETPMLIDGWAQLRPDRTADEMRSHVAAVNPLGRIGTPDDIASAVLFLASPEASFITGGEIVVDGGVINKLALPVTPAK